MLVCILNPCVKVFDWNSLSLCPLDRRRSIKNAKARTEEKASQQKTRRKRRIPKRKRKTVTRRKHLSNLQSDAKGKKSSVVKS